MTLLERQFYAMSPSMRRPEKRHWPRAIVPALRVDAARRAAADRALQYARLALPLDGPMVIRWMAPPSGKPGERLIMAPAHRDAYVEPIGHPAEVFLSATVSTPVNTVLHELRHHWQFRNGWYPAPDSCPEPGCNHLIYTLTPADEDRLELDAFRWGMTRSRKVPSVERRGLV